MKPREGGSMFTVGVMFFASVVFMLASIFLFMKSRESGVEILEEQVNKMIGEAKISLEKSEKLLQETRMAHEKFMEINLKLAEVEESLKLQEQKELKLVIGDNSKPFYVQVVGEGLSARVPILKQKKNKQKQLTQ